jgi:hypothetical protein
MTPTKPKTLRHRSRKGRANARPLQTESQKTETSDITDEVTCSLIETFPASDPPAWAALARVGGPKRTRRYLALPQNPGIFDPRNIDNSLSNCEQSNAE